MCSECIVATEQPPRTSLAHRPVSVWETRSPSREWGVQVHCTCSIHEPLPRPRELTEDLTTKIAFL